MTEKAALETGLLAGTPVSAGYADGPAMALGLGATDESLISVISGTWGLNQLASRIPITDGSISAPIIGPRVGEFILTDAGPTSASAFEWFIDSVVARADGGRRDRDALFDFCNGEVAQTRASDAIPIFFRISTADSISLRRAAHSSASPRGTGCRNWCALFTRAWRSSIAAISSIS